MMTNEEILKIALAQSACDCGCEPEDFLNGRNIVTISKKNEKARKYLPLPFECDMITYGGGIIAQTSERTAALVREYIEKYPVEHAFETPHIHALDERLSSYGLKVCFMAEYFLPDVNKLKIFSCEYEIRILHKDDFKELYLPQWSNAICEKRKELDVLCIGAYDGDRLIGMAGCSADCENMHQIGIDVLAEYRGQGVAKALTSRLTAEVLALGKVPFYCAAWCNIKSVRNAIACGYYPAWCELTARETEFVNGMNK